MLIAKQLSKYSAGDLDKAEKVAVPIATTLVKERWGLGLRGLGLLAM